jgi:hypothetical protein
MHFFFDVSIPKNTAKVNPYLETLLLYNGEIRHVEITIPIGHKGKAHLQLLDHGFQVYPLSSNEDYHGDGSQITFDDRYQLEGGQFALKARGWNTDTVSDHAFLIGIDVEEPDPLLVSGNARTLADLQALIGLEVS